MRTGTLSLRTPIFRRRRERWSSEGRAGSTTDCRPSWVPVETIAPVTGADALAIDEIPGPRWEIALQLLTEGGPTVLLDGEVRIGIQRWLGFPLADGKIHIYTWTELEPSRLSPAIIENGVRAALATLDRALAADERLGRILETSGVEYEILSDYGMGAVKVATFRTDGSYELQ
jgi:hypothetical protein